jgi:hypothetical protein
MFTLLLISAAVLTAYGLFLRRASKVRVRGTASVIPERVPEGRLWTWGRGAWGLVFGPDLEKTLSTEVAEALLAVTWGVAEAADLDRAEAAMAARMPAAKTWRLVRTAGLLRLAVVGGVIPVPEATARMAAVAGGLEALHDSWEEVAEAFASEHARFLEEKETADNQERTPGLARLPEAAQIERTRAWLAREVWSKAAFRDAA